jgi:8-oxo-dGTP pyrophosphatase MutT (NUDIX family)
MAVRVGRAMGTTAIFAEILIAGLEALAWLFLLVIAVVDLIWFQRSGYRDWLQPSDLGGWQVLGTTVAIASAYVAGILVDRFADSTETMLWNARPGRAIDKPARIAKMRLVIMREGGDLAKFLEYQRSRFRIARATAVNSLFAAVAVPLFLWTDTHVGAAASVATGAALLVVTFSSQRAFRRIEVAYLTRLSDAYRLLRDDWQPKHAAAVAYKWDGNRLKFLLVTTSDSHTRWTFPKGRYDDDEDETLADTAEREAREEAGIKAKAGGKRLLVYRFPKKGQGDRPVAAFLLETRKENLERHGDDAQRHHRVGRVGGGQEAALPRA